MADEPERAHRAVGQDLSGTRLGEEPEQGMARRAVPAVDAVTAGLGAARQPEHVASAGDDPVRSKRPGVVISGDQQVDLTSRADELSRDRLASDQITETPAFVDPGRLHGAQHSQEPFMATVHVGANADPHRASCWLARPEGWLVPAEAVGHPRRPTSSLIAPDYYAWRPIETPLKLHGIRDAEIDVSTSN
jgi:hypothetical protein